MGLVQRLQDIQEERERDSVIGTKFGDAIALVPELGPDELELLISTAEVHLSAMRALDARDAFEVETMQEAEDVGDRYEDYEVDRRDYEESLDWPLESRL